MNSIPPDLRKQLDDASQVHILKFWDVISDAEKQSLLNQISNTDLQILKAIWQSSMSDHSPQEIGRAHV